MCEPGLGNSGLFSTSAGHTCSVQPWMCSTAWTGLEWALSQGLGAAVTTQDPTAPLPPSRAASLWRAGIPGGVGFLWAHRDDGHPIPCSELRKAGQGSPGAPKRIGLWLDFAVKFTGTSLLD